MNVLQNASPPAETHAVMLTKANELQILRVLWTGTAKTLFKAI
jgi:hypothetical protein